jgi:hypothetical protein
LGKARARANSKVLQRILVENPEWNFSYSLVSTGNRVDDMPYRRLSDFSVHGQVTRGDTKGISVAKLIVFPREFDDRQTEVRPIGAGWKRGEQIEFVTWLPHLDLQSILTVSASGRLVAFSLGFHPFRYGKSPLHAVSFETQFDVDNW